MSEYFEKQQRLSIVLPPLSYQVSCRSKPPSLDPRLPLYLFVPIYLYTHAYLAVGKYVCLFVW